MKLHYSERPNVRQSAEFIDENKYGGWVQASWLWSCVLGSVIAITISAALSVVSNTYLAEYRAGTYKLAAVELLAIACVLEGSLIGYFQWRVLRRMFPTMSSMHWISATMIAAGSGYLIRSLPTSFALTATLAANVGDNTLGPALISRISLISGALVGLVWGCAQYAVLRLHVHRAGSWVLASVGAWTISFVCLFVSAFLPDRTTSPVIHIALGAASGLVLGLALGLTQGRVLARLHPRLLVSVP